MINLMFKIKIKPSSPSQHPIFANVNTFERPSDLVFVDSQE
jgi:hypothetical protein